LPACTGDGTAVVARLQPAPVAAGGGSTVGNDGGPPPGDAGDSGIGPGGAIWWTYAEPTGSSDWGAPPTADAVSVIAKSPPDVRAGLEFEFPNGVTRDLAQFDKLELTAQVTEGDMFELFLGRDLDHGCSYVFPKGQSNAYSTGLASPSWCVPTQCGFDLQIRGGLLLAHVPTDSVLTATLTDMRFYLSPSGVPAGSASALGGSSGPGGFCWFLAKWNSAIASWVVANPTSSGAHVSATASANGVAGMAFEIPSGFRLSQYRTLVIDATVSDAATQNSMNFLVQAVKLTQGRGWQRQGDAKRRSYRIDLTQPEYVFSGTSSTGALSLDDVSRIEIVTKSNGGDTKIDAYVYGIEFQP
jgi:hypothetical protein